MHSRTTLALALLALVPAALAAQDVARDTARAAPVVVTATRSPLAADRAPASVTVLTGAQLRREGIATVADALRQVPGLSLAQTGSYGASTSLFIRGGESKFTKVLIDGVPVNEAGGAFDFSSLTTDNLDRIEIVRGPASVLYGSDAVAGVVQLFTRRGAGPLRGELAARGGGFGSYDADGAVRGASDVVSYSLGAGKHGTNGFQAFNSGFTDNTGSGLLRVSRGAVDAGLSLRLSDVAFHFPTNGSGQVVDSNAVHREDRLAVGLDAGTRLGSAVSVRLALASLDAHGATSDQPDSPGDSTGYYYATADRSRRRSGDLRLDVGLAEAARLTVGGQIEREWQASETQSNFGATPADPHARRTTGVYSQLLLQPAGRSTVTLGGRLDHNERFGDFFTYRAGTSVELRPGTRLRASVGTAFREPTFLENFGSAFVIGNTALKPEHSFSVDGGVEQALADWGSVSATYFANSFRDLIDYRYSATQPNYFNLARTRASGVELEGRATLPAGFHADMAATYLDARVVDPGTSVSPTAAFAPGGRLLRRPMHTLTGAAGYRSARGGLDLRATRVGPRDDDYFAPDFSTQRVVLPAYVLTDLAGELSLTPATARGTLAATFRIENLFDVRYSNIAGYNYDFARTDEASLRLTGYRGAGRRALIGARVGY
jgi:vitamin B12 transporter